MRNRRAVQKQSSAGWDPRFYMNEGPKLTSHTTTRSRTPVSKYQQLARRVRTTITKEEILDLKKEILRTWRQEKIPEILRDAFINRVFKLPRNTAAGIVATEIYELKNKSAAVQLALQAIKAREQCLSNMRKIDSYLTDASQEMFDTLQSEIQEQLLNLRMHSMNVVEQVSNWKFALGQHSGKPEDHQPAFVYKQENYLLKMNSDCSWLKRSAISKFIDFGDKADTFLSNIIAIPDLVLSTAFLGKVMMCRKVLGDELFADDLYVSPNKSTALEMPVPPKEITPLHKKVKMQQAMTLDDKSASLLKHTVADSLIDQLFIWIAPDLLNQYFAEGVEQELEDAAFHELPIIVNEIATDHYTTIVGDQLQQQDSTIFQELVSKILDDVLDKQVKESAPEVPISPAPVSPSRDKRFDTIISEEIWTKLISGYCAQEADDMATVVHIKATEQHKRQELQRKATEKEEELQRQATEKKEELERQATEKAEELERQATEKKEELERQATEKAEELERQATEKAKEAERRAQEKAELKAKEAQRIAEEAAALDAKVDAARLKAKVAAEQQPLEIDPTPMVISIPTEELSIEVDVLSEADKATISEQLYDNLLLKVLEDTCKRATVGGSGGRKIGVDEMRDLQLNFLTVADLETIEDKSKLDVQFVPIELSAERALEQISLYIAQSDPQMELKFEILQFVISKLNSGLDASWYWIQNDKGIYGLLSFNTEVTAQALIRVNIGHISTITSSVLPVVLGKAKEFIGDMGIADVIAWHLYMSKNEAGQFSIDPAIRKAFQEQGFKWKALINDSNTGQRYLEMTYEADPNWKQVQYTRYRIILKGSVTMHYTPETSPLNETPNASRIGEYAPTQAMLEGGLRYNMAHALAKILDIDAPDMRNRLARDVRDLAEGWENAEIPEISLDEADSHIISHLDIEATWKYGNYSMINGQKYIRFTGPKMLKQSSSDESVLYTLPIVHPEIMFTIIVSPGFMNELSQEAERHSTDLMFKVDSLLKSLEPEYESIEEFCLPCFRKQISSRVPWIEGLILSQRQEIEDCEEELTVEVSADVTNPGSLRTENVGDDVITGDFILVGSHRKVSESLDLPLFVCYVKKENWIT